MQDGHLKWMNPLTLIRDETRLQFIQDGINSAFATFGKRKKPKGAKNAGGRESPEGSAGSDEGGATGGVATGGGASGGGGGASGGGASATDTHTQGTYHHSAFVSFNGPKCIICAKV